MGDIGEAEMEKDEYWLWLGTIPGIGNVTALKLLNAFGGDIRVLYEADKKTIAGRHIVSEKQLQSIIYSRNRDRICRAYAQMKEKGIQCLSIVDTHYPDMLKSLHDPPIVLYFLGSIPAPEEWMIALIGARQCSSYGRQVSRMLARGIAASGLPVVSGMARGSDSAAHWGALEEGGRTFAVLGCGVDVCYPRENIDLYTEIGRNGGILSEFPPGTKPEGYHFPRRNRLIAALAKGIVVTEAKQKSGTLTTVEHGLDLGKDIFAVPGRIDDALSEGCNQLIRAGAKLVMQPSDILEEFGILAREYKKNNITLDNSEKVVYASICLVPRSVDEIAVLTGMDVQGIIHCLVRMELKGIIHRVGKNQYVLSI